VLIFDITDPTNPTLLGTYTATNAQAIAHEGDLLYIADGSAGLTVIDVTDPTAPSFVGNINPPGAAWDIVVEGNVAYVANAASGLYVFDVSDPTTPTQIGAYNTPNQAHGVDVSGDYCYVADRSGSGLIVLDVSDPTTPTLAGNLVLAGDSWSVTVDGDLAYVGDAAAGLAIVDVSDPSTPTLLGSIDPGSVRRAAVERDFVYAAGYAMVHVIDVSDPTNPTLRQSWDNPGIASDVAVAGDYAFVADGAAGGVQVLKIRDKLSDPFLVTTDPGWANDIEVRGNHAFMGRSNGFYVYDISDPWSLTEIGCIDTLDVRELAIAGDYAFVDDDNYDFVTVDISNPSAPVVVGRVTPSGFIIQALAVAGNHAFVMAGGLSIVDISDPSNPALVTTAGVTGGSSGLAISGDLAFVGGSAFSVVDITNLASPVVIGSYNWPDVVYDLELAGDHVFAGGSGSNFFVMDVSDPTNPVVVDNVNAVDVVRDLAVSGDYLYVATDATLRVYDISDVSSVITLEIVPYVYGKSLAISGGRVLLGTITQTQLYQVLQGEWDLTNNRGQSVLLPSTIGTPVSARLTTTQVGTITWKVGSQMGGLDAIVPDGQWTPITTPGPDIYWQTEHEYSGPYVNPAVSDLDLEWRIAEVITSSIDDVPDDQGGWLRVNFVRSGYDYATEPSYPVTGYQIYQRVDAASESLLLSEVVPMSAAGSVEALPGVDPAYQLRLGGRRFVVGAPSPVAAAGTFPPGMWEAVGWVAATQSDSYSVRVSTTADSMLTENNYSVYVVTTHTTTPSVWFVSEPDSGYSVDNIAPGAPQNLTISYNTGSGNTLSWDAAPEPDFQFYRVYRSSDPNFIPAPEDIVHEGATPAWNDPEYDGWAVYYKVTTLDHAGNESDPSGGDTVTGPDDPRPPKRFALYANVPNPFNPTTRIRYQVPDGGALVTLRVYDVTGRLVRTLVDGTHSAGVKTVQWEGRDDRGIPVASGVYYYRMQAGTFSRTRSMVLLK
jgi:hypothetical protein